MKFNDIDDADPIPTFVALAKAISPLHLAYLHVMRAGIGAETALREAYSGTFLLGGGFLKYLNSKIPAIRAWEAQRA